jgi:hypothetical protein
MGTPSLPKIWDANCSRCTAATKSVARESDWCVQQPPMPNQRTSAIDPERTVSFRDPLPLS